MTKTTSGIYNNVHIKGSGSTKAAWKTKKRQPQFKPLSRNSIPGFTDNRVPPR